MVLLVRTTAQPRGRLLSHFGLAASRLFPAYATGWTTINGLLNAVFRVAVLLQYFNVAGLIATKHLRANFKTTFTLAAFTEFDDGNSGQYTSFGGSPDQR
jgi:hypothetical protein